MDRLRKKNKFINDIFLNAVLGFPQMCVGFGGRFGLIQTSNIGFIGEAICYM